MFMVDQVLNNERQMYSGVDYDPAPWRVMHDLSSYMIKTIVGKYNPISKKRTDPTQPLNTQSNLVAHVLRSVAATDLMHREKVKKSKDNITDKHNVAMHAITRFFGDGLTGDGQKDRHVLGAYLIYVKSLYGDIKNNDIIHGLKKFMGSELARTDLEKAVTLNQGQVRKAIRENNKKDQIKFERLLGVFQNTQRLQNMPAVTQFILDNLTDEKLSYYNEFLLRLKEQETASHAAYLSLKAERKEKRKVIQSGSDLVGDVSSQKVLPAADSKPGVIPPPPPALPPLNLGSKPLSSASKSGAPRPAARMTPTDMLKDMTNQVLRHITDSDKQAPLPSNPAREAMLSKIKTGQASANLNKTDGPVKSKPAAVKGLLGQIQKGTTLRKVTEEDLKKAKKERQEALNSDNPIAFMKNSLLLRRASMEATKGSDEEDGEERDDWSDDEKIN